MPPPDVAEYTQQAGLTPRVIKTFKGFVANERSRIVLRPHRAKRECAARCAGGGSVGCSATLFPERLTAAADCNGFTGRLRSSPRLSRFCTSAKPCQPSGHNPSTYNDLLPFITASQLQLATSQGGLVMFSKSFVVSACAVAM